MTLRPVCERCSVALIVAAHILLALTFSAGPIFEGPDEIEHYRYVRYLVSERSLPPPTAQPRGEYHQAPLYYLLAAPLAMLTDDQDFAQIEGRLNPYYGAHIDATGNDNKNLYLHTRAEAFPYTDSPTARAVHLLRLLSVLLGAGTVVLSHAILRLLWPEQPSRRLLALGLIAFWPQFIYLSSVITNDSLLITLATACLWLIVRAIRTGWNRRIALALGAVLGAMMLTKVSAVFALLPVVLAFAMDRRAWHVAPLTAAAVAIVAGGWYARNALIYGDPTLTQAMLRSWESEVIRPGTLALDVAWERVPFAYETAWARFGQGAVPVGRGIYALFDAMVIASLVGLAMRMACAVWVTRHTWLVMVDTRTTLVITAFAGAWVGSLFYLASVAWSGNQGRYVLPGIAAWTVLIATGLEAWVPRRVRLPFALGTIAILGSVAAVCAFGYFLPAYRVASVPEPIAHPLAYRYAGVAELIGMAPAAPKAHPGETIRLSLYWRALEPADAHLQTYLHSVESAVVRRDSLPGTGNLLAADWEPGQTWAEHYVVAIPPDTPPQTVYTLVAGLYDPAVARPLEATNADGQPVTPVIGRIAIRGPRGASDPAYRFGTVIGLDAPRLAREGDRLAICLRWTALAATSVDYTIFAHVQGKNGALLAQADVQPRGGAYPTGTWSPGEVIDDCIEMDVPALPAGGWRVALGLYSLPDLTRLPVRAADGQVLPDDQVIVQP